MVVTLAQVGQLPVAAGRADQRDAKGQAIGPQAAGHRDRGIVQQVDEVGVGAQVAVQRHGVGLHLRHGVVRGRGGHQQHVDAGSGQLVVQAVIALAAVALSGVVTAVVAIALKATMGWRVSEDDETAGIDQNVHAETGYDWGSLGAAIGRGAGPVVPAAAPATPEEVNA